GDRAGLPAPRAGRPTYIDSGDRPGLKRGRARDESRRPQRGRSCRQGACSSTARGRRPRAGPSTRCRIRPPRRSSGRLPTRASRTSRRRSPRSTPRERARAIDRIADGFERRKEELRAILVAETGATYMTHEVQLEAPIQFMRNFASLAESFQFYTMLPPRDAGPMLGGGVVSGVAYRQPVGVCALMPTWNFPVFLVAQKIGPALATGCTMVMKPSPYGPLVNLMLAEIIAEADLPPGVVNVVTTQSVDAAATLVTDPRIDKVSFTGSSATGKRIM